MTSGMASVRLESVVKRFGRTIAVDRVSLEIGDGEFFVLLGPSGCGKTTTLRLIAGLEYPDEGRVYIGGEDVTYREPGERNVAMVFQNYALYPNMKVYDNIAFPLKVRRRKLGLSNSDIRERVLEVARMLRIEELLDRKPGQLSGGQQQRVALARALVRRPSVWLMDEPLSNLDALLRIAMRAELKRLQKELGITTIYVTHDQAEALSMADRIAVMDRGRVMQVGSPQEVFLEPRHVFVATFLGSPPMNIVRCRISYSQETAQISCPGFTRIVPQTVGEGEVYLGIRPEFIKIAPHSGEGALRAEVLVVEPLGVEKIITASLDGETQIKIKTALDVEVKPGDTIYLELDWSRVSVFDAESGRILETLTKELREP